MLFQLSHRRKISEDWCNMGSSLLLHNNPVFSQIDSATVFEWSQRPHSKTLVLCVLKRSFNIFWGTFPFSSITQSTDSKMLVWTSCDLLIHQATKLMHVHVGIKLYVIKIIFISYSQVWNPGERMLCISGVAVERVRSTKFLGVHVTKGEDPPEPTTPHH